MNKFILIFVLTITISNKAFSSESVFPDRWNYLEISRVEVDLERGGNLNGYGVDAKFSLNNIFYLSGTYQDYSSSDIADVNRYLFGFGARYEINKLLTPYAQIEHVTVDSTRRYSNTSVNLNYWMLGAGISGVTNGFGYKLAITHYEAISDTLDNYSGYYAEIYYAINKKASLGMEVEHQNDSGDVYSYAFRYHY